MNEKKIDKFRNTLNMIEETNGLTLSQVCSLTNIDSMSIQNWIKRGYAPHPENKKYFNKHISRLLLITALKEAMYLEEIGDLMTCINGNVDDTSDDIISESLLLEFYLEMIEDLKLNADEEYIEKVVKDVTKKYKHPNKNKVIYALEVMAYAYIGLACQKKVDKNLNKLKGK